MKVYDFYQPCKESAIYSTLQGNNPNLEFAKAIKKVLGMMRENRDTEFLLTALRKELEASFKEEWFRISFHKDQTITDDVKKFSRFLEWMALFGEYNIVDTNVNVKADVLEEEYTLSVSLIIEKEDCSHEGIVIHTGKNPFSFKARKVHTLAQNNLYGLVAKYALDAIYPGITISNVYLTQEKDSLGNIQDKFLVSNGKGSNVHRLYFEEFYSNGELCYEALFNALVVITTTPIEKNCYMCPNQALCSTQSMKFQAEEIIEEKEYTMPTFTETQKLVVNHKKGPMLVVAGPGSGKTATLVGRIKCLLENDIEPDYILAITFTKDAAKELQNRISSFCDESDMPTVSTINALCYQILRDNSEVLGREVELLTQRKRLEVIESLVDALGLNYSINNGQQLMALSRKIDNYVALGRDKDAFLASEKNVGEEFIDLAEYYLNILKERNYITFDEQISLCVKFLKDNTDVLRGYQNLYRYIMVDEYQDIDPMQNEFITLLAQHQNLVVVGDDDQSIYGFRGGSSKYILNFKNTYPDAEVVVLNENFRTTAAIAAATNEIISLNKTRISKEIKAVREGGTAPVYVDGVGAQSVTQCINDALKKGYAYGDIAVLSQTNKTLENLKDTLEYPCILEKAYLINEPLFIASFYSLALIKSDYKNTDAMLHLCKAFGVTLEANTNGSLYESVKLNADAYSKKLIEFLTYVEDISSYPACDYIRVVASLLGLEGTKAHNKMVELIKESSLNTVDEAFELFDSMVRYEDDTKVSVANIDAILLITNHESKGREFPVVILVDDKGVTTEEERRVHYVAMTRAEDLLYVLQENKESSACA